MAGRGYTEYGFTAEIIRQKIGNAMVRVKNESTSENSVKQEPKHLKKKKATDKA